MTQKPKTTNNQNEPVEGDPIVEPVAAVTDPGTDPVLETTPTSTPTVTPPQQNPIDYERKFKGMQREYNNLKIRYDTLNESHIELSGQYEVLKSEMEELKKQIGTLDDTKKSLGDAQTALENLKSQQAKETQTLSVVLGEYPELADLYTSGVIKKVDDPVEQKKIFDLFRDKLTKTSKQNLLQTLGSGLPPVSNGTPAEQKQTMDEVYKKMNALAGSRDPKSRSEFLELQKKWIELNEA